MKKLGLAAILSSFAFLTFSGMSGAHIEPGLGFNPFQNACQEAGWEFDMGGPSGDGGQGSTCTHTGDVVQDDSVVVIPLGSSEKAWTYFETTTFVHVSTWSGPGPDGVTTVVTEGATTAHCISPAGREVR